MNAHDEIEKSKNELISFVKDNLHVTEVNYPTLCAMLNYDDRLFTKIMEEIKKGNLYISDFNSLFENNEFLAKSIEEQEELYQKKVKFLEMTSTLLASGKQVFTGDDSEYNTYYANNDITDNSSMTQIEIDKTNDIVTILTSDSSDPYSEQYKKEILKDLITKSDTGSEDILLSFHDYIVPVDYESLYLTDYDKKFAKDNFITDDTMKKVKSLAAYFSTYYE